MREAEGGEERFGRGEGERTGRGGRQEPSRLVKEELRRMRIEAKRYRPGWTSLGVGEKEMREVALVAGVKVGSRGWATMTAGNRTTARQMPPHRASDRWSAPAPRHRGGDAMVR